MSFPNFGHWRIRLELGFRGRMPITDNLPETWYDTPNIHFCTIRDFLLLCRDLGVTVERGIAMNRDGDVLSIDGQGRLANLFATQGLFVLSRA